MPAIYMAYEYLQAIELSSQQRCSFIIETHRVEAALHELQMNYGTRFHMIDHSLFTQRAQETLCEELEYECPPVRMVEALHVLWHEFVAEGQQIMQKGHICTSNVEFTGVIGSEEVDAPKIFLEMRNVPRGKEVPCNRADIEQLMIFAVSVGIRKRLRQIAAHSIMHN